MINVAKRKGCACATGFYNVVSGAELFALRVMNAIKNNSGCTIEEAIALASNMYSEEELVAYNCPANPGNLRTIGSTNISIDMR